MKTVIRHAPVEGPAPRFRAGAILRTWLERIRARRMLARVDERTLRELGIAPSAADYEGAAAVLAAAARPAPVTCTPP